VVEALIRQSGIQPGMLEQLKNKLTRSENTDIRNVEPLLASRPPASFPGWQF